jgi:hypothetical protein
LAAWDVESGNAIERFQLTKNRLTKIALRPGKTEFAVCGTTEESDFVAVWDYSKRVQLFYHVFTEAVTFIDYSAKGSYIMVTLDAQNSLVVLDSENGNITQSNYPDASYCSFAATGASEKNIITYSELGRIIYFDRLQQNCISSFEVEPELKNIILFGSRRFLAGLSGSNKNQELVVYDATSARELERIKDNGITSIFSMGMDNSSFGILSNAANNAKITFYIISNTGKVSTTVSRFIAYESDRLSPDGNQHPSLVFQKGILVDSFVIANSDAVEPFYSSLYSIDDFGYANNFISNNNILISDIEPVDELIAFITENGMVGTVPKSFKSFKEGDTIFVTRRQADTPQEENDEAVNYLLKTRSTEANIRGISIYNDKVLTLDTGGNIRVINYQTQELLFSYTLTTAQDALFFDDDHIIISRSTGEEGESAFLLINSDTEETINIDVSAVLGMNLYKAPGGKIYSSIIRIVEGKPETAIINLNINFPSSSGTLESFAGEDGFALFTEYKNNIVSTLGSDTAHIVDGRTKRELERSAGLPVALASSEYLCVLDGDGGLCYFDEKGKLLAVLKLYEATWTLISGATTIKGPLEVL